jgi:DNA-binding NarL/FixJ family response regulator
MKTKPIRLDGISVLIIEDEYFVAQELATELQAHGARVVGPVPDIARARATIADESPDCVLIDINLRGEFVFELAEEILACGIPAIFTTGYDISFLPEDLRRAPLLQKPIQTHELLRAVHREAAARLTQ